MKNEMEAEVIVYHNSRCSKSRCALDFLTEKGVPFTVIEYLKDTPAYNELENIIDKLGIEPEELIRKGEDDYKLNFKGKMLSKKEWIDAMIKFPKLIERPIVIKGNKAVIGRPTEKILDLF